MKKSIVAVLLVVICCSFKSGLTVNPDFLGTWRCVYKTKDGQVKENIITLEAGKKGNAMDVYRKKDADGHPYYTLHLTDSTHFKGRSTENISGDVSAEHNVTGYFEGHRLYTYDHVEHKNFTTHTQSQNDWNYMFKKWDPATGKYIDFPADDPHALSIIQSR